MQRDIELAADVSAQARGLGYRVWTIDGSCTADEIAAQITAELPGMISTGLGSTAVAATHHQLAS